MLAIKVSIPANATYIRNLVLGLLFVKRLYERLF